MDQIHDQNAQILKLQGTSGQDDRVGDLCALHLPQLHQNHKYIIEQPLLKPPED